MKKLLIITITLTFFSVPTYAKTVIGCRNTTHGATMCVHSSWHEFWGIQSSCSELVTETISSGGNCWIVE